VDAERAKGWSNEEVLRRWTQLFNIKDTHFSCLNP